MLEINIELLPEEQGRRRYIEMLRRIPPGRRLELTAELCDMTRSFLEKEIRAAYPDITDEDVRKEIIRMTVPEGLRKKAYDW